MLIELGDLLFEDFFSCHKQFLIDFCRELGYFNTKHFIYTIFYSLLVVAFSHNICFQLGILYPLYLGLNPLLV